MNVSGLLGEEDLHAAPKQVAAGIRQQGKVRILVLARAQVARGRLIDMCVAHEQAMPPRCESTAIMRVDAIGAGDRAFALL